ncbi:Auxin efflux carrier [Cynara cardunculus var. scolymus]|uniref:Auxin efflux carrier n=1 Tax=Cynara cardunculus var. scolymus TaxID=59895 RepID=A0A103YGJ1_CYNCS|nr:Auxin efflux carrier [Cynara cardunculus var. scolymus]
MAVVDLFVVALIPVLKTLLITALGLLLAVDRVNIMGDAARHHLNNVVFYVFIPALVGGSLADTVTATSIVSLWFMPVNILLTFIIGSALGWMLVKITRTPQHLHGLVIGSSAAGNLGNLLLIIIPAIGAIYIWTYVYNIIRAYGNVSGKDLSKASTISIDCSGKTLDMFNENYTESLLQTSRASFEGCEVQDDEYSDVEEQNSEFEDDEVEKETGLTKIKQHFHMVLDKINLKMWLTPSTIATVLYDSANHQEHFIVGLLIGVISPIRKLMIGDNAPLRVIDSSASLLGQATVPAMTLIVGANLFKGLKKSGVGLWLVIGILVVRYVALPLVGIGIVKAAHRVGFVGSDSLYQFVLLIQYSLPPAMAIGTITQLFEVGESECAVIMLWTYVVAAIALTFWSTLFMWIMGFLDLFSAASMPVLKVLILTGLGSFLALDSIDILGQSTRKQVNNIVFFVFSPALVGSNLANTITVKSISSMWFMPVNVLLTFIIGSALAWVLKGSPFGDPDVCHEYAMAYASLSMALGAVFLWSYVYNLVRFFSGHPQDSGTNGVTPLKEEDLTENLLPSSSSSTVNIKGKVKVMLDTMKQNLGKFSRRVNLKAIFAPSTIGAMVGFIIGTIAPMRRVLIGTAAPLRVIQDSASLIGDAAIPTMTLIVGGNLLKGLKGSGVPLSVVFGIVGVRYVLLPVFGILIVKGALYLGLVAADPLYLFALLIQFAVPPAMNIGTITQLFGAGESECSVIMLWAYGLASISLTLWSMLFMWLIVFFVFNPALVATNLATTITYESIVSMWFMPVNILATFIIGSALGWMLIVIATPPQHLKGLILGACAADWSRVSVGLCLQPSTGFLRPRFRDRPTGVDPNFASFISLFEFNYHEAKREGDVRCNEATSGELLKTDQLEAGVCTIDYRSGMLLFSSSYVTFSVDKGQPSMEAETYMHITVSFVVKIVGFVVGTIGPLRRLLIGTTAPLRVIQDSASLVGDAAIPTVTLIVGGNLLRGLKGSGISLRIVFGIVAVRYLLLPVFGILIVKGALYLGLVPADPLYIFVLLLQFALPPAMNIGTITQLFGAGESECSVIMLWAYGLASISLTLWSTFFMWLVA